MKTNLLVLLTFLLLGCGFAPPSSVPINYSLGWWKNQDSFAIKSLNARFKYSQRGLFAGDNILTITIKGELYGNENRKPKIKETHVSQERMQSSEKYGLEAVINITPVIEISNTKAYTGETIPFEIVQNIKIKSMDFGNNIYHIKCGNFTTTSNFHQAK